ncbi:MAG TPA: thiamine diphosphokinase [Ignavibacteriaceae bacterium]|nr:thiamine diphosphokinase [Ignavibacteriaceae bacterium]
MKKCIILANGKSPKKSVIKFLQKHNYTTLICADGGANKALNLNLIPDFIIGDLDSIEDSTLKYYQDKSEIIKLKRQNDTDVEKCLKFAIQKKYDEVILLGVTGNRLDHTFCNLGIVIKFFKKIKLKIIAEESLLIPYSGKVELKTSPGEIISIYGFDKKTKITSTGLKYPLKNSILPFGEKESTSNVSISEKVILHINGGIIFIVRNFNTAKSYALS